MKFRKRHYQMRWNKSSRIKKSHQNLRITQAYCWLYTKDRKIILVSKGDQRWQFPGGHPQEGESLKKILIREVLEETSLNIKPYADRLTFFGYYVVEEIFQDEIINQYLQVRFLLKLPFYSDELRLFPQEGKNEKDKDKIRKARCFSLEEAAGLIPWLQNSEELQAFSQTQTI